MQGEDVVYIVSLSQLVTSRCAGEIAKCIPRCLACYSKFWLTDSVPWSLAGNIYVRLNRALQHKLDSLEVWACDHHPIPLEVGLEQVWCHQSLIRAFA